MPTPAKCYLQTHHDGSWVTLKDPKGRRLEFDLTNATLNQLEICPSNARLVSLDGCEVVSKLGVTAYRAKRRWPEPRPEGLSQPRPVIRTRTGLPERIAKPRFNSLLQSGHRAIITRLGG